MASCQRNPQSLYADVLQSNPEANFSFLSSSSSHASLYPSLNDPPPPLTAAASSSLYPSFEIRDLVENLLPDADEEAAALGKSSAATEPPDNPNLLQTPVEETLILLSGAILHLIDRRRSVDLGSGEFSVVRLNLGENAVAVLARVGEAVQWPLAKDEAAVRLDDSHYFFSLHVPEGSYDAGDEDNAGAAAGGYGPEELLNYGLTFASKGQEGMLKELDAILERYSSFSVQKVAAKAQDRLPG